MASGDQRNNVERHTYSLRDLGNSTRRRCTGESNKCPSGNPSNNSSLTDIDTANMSSKMLDWAATRLRYTRKVVRSLATRAQKPKFLVLDESGVEVSESLALFEEDRCPRGDHP